MVDIRKIIWLALLECTRKSFRITGQESTKEVCHCESIDLLLKREMAVKLWLSWTYCRLDQMFSDAFTHDHQLLKADPKHCLYLACGLIVRGSVEMSDIRRNIDRSVTFL